MEQGPTKTEIGWNLPFSWFDFKQCNATRATTFISTLFWLINLISHNQGLKNCKIRQIGWKASFSTIKIRDCFHLGRLVAPVNKGGQLKQRFTSMNPMTWIKADLFNKGKLAVFWKAMKHKRANWLHQCKEFAPGVSFTRINWWNQQPAKKETGCIFP